jgi:hypothetical protein
VGVRISSCGFQRIMQQAHLLLMDGSARTGCDAIASQATCPGDTASAVSVAPYVINTSTRSANSLAFPAFSFCDARLFIGLVFTDTAVRQTFVLHLRVGDNFGDRFVVSIHGVQYLNFLHQGPLRPFERVPRLEYF